MEKRRNGIQFNTMVVVSANDARVREATRASRTWICVTILLYLVIRYTKRKEGKRGVKYRWNVIPRGDVRVACLARESMGELRTRASVDTTHAKAYDEDEDEDERQQWPTQQGDTLI